MKKVFVSGGSRGIGREVVRLFAKKGWQVAFSYQNSVKEAEELVKELSQITAIHAFRADLAVESEILALCDRVLAEFGEVDVLVNNAGVSSYGLFTDVDEKEYERVMNVNVKSAFFLTRALTPSMIREKRGSIVNVSSVWGQTGASCEVLYSSSKAALIGFTKALAKELAPSSIAVNCVAPGVVDTDMMKHFSPEDRKAIEEEIPASRFASPVEVAEVIVSLAESPCQYVTGQIIGVNGGMYC